MSKTGCALMGSTILGGHSAIEEIDWIAEGEAFGRDPSGERMWEVGKWWFRFDRVLTKRSRKQIIEFARLVGTALPHLPDRRASLQPLLRGAGRIPKLGKTSSCQGAACGPCSPLVKGSRTQGVG